MERLGFYINKKMVYVEVQRTKNKNMYLKVKEDRLVVSAANNVSKQVLTDFVSEHIDKFYKYLDEKKKTELYSLKENYINLLGKKFQLIILTGFNDMSLVIKGKNVYVNTQGGTDKEAEKVIKDYLKSDLLRYIAKAMPKFEKKMNLDEHFAKVVYKTATWGTNKVGTNKLSFSSRLSHYRREITDYVIVHELAHTIEGNHSNEFWEVVEKYVPNYKNLRNELKVDQTLNE